MAVQFGPYFINSETFSTASGVWTSNTLVTCAPSGYYSNGVIQRYLTNSGSSTCSLGPVLDCPSCAPPSVSCGAAYPQNGNAGDMFKLSVGLGTGAGVALIGINPVGVPDSIAVRFPSGSGTIIAEGSSQVHGYASNNNTSGSTVLEDYLVYVGDGYDYNLTWPGIASGSAACGAAQWDCATYPAGSPITSPPYDVYEWDDAAGGFPATPTSTGFTCEISGYSGTSGTQLPNVTQMGVIGIDQYGACQSNTIVANCTDNLGAFFIPVTKTSLYAQNVDVVFAGTPLGAGSTTGFGFLLVCPQVPTPFEMSALITETNDPLVTPPCTDGSPGVYPNTLHQISLWNTPESIGANTPGGINFNDDVYNQGVLAINSFAYMNTQGTGVRWNEGPVATVNPTGGTFKYQWYKVNLVTGGPNEYKTLKLNNGAINWGAAPQDTSALIQIDDNGVITNIIPCNN
tara:strand:+ start:28587 stop:29957 length:1371 start_codon:yes stop_codon:yes gene_type:complete